MGRPKHRYAAHDEVDGHQATQRFERNAVVGDAKVRAFHEQQPEVAGKVGMAEKIVVAGPRGQQSDGWVDAIGAARQRRPSCRKNGASRRALQAAKMSPATLV